MSLPAAGSTFVVIALCLSDFFSCAVGGYEQSSSPSECEFNLQLELFTIEWSFEHFHWNTKHGPKRPSVSVSPSGEILEGRSVTLTCNSDANPAATYTWYKDNRQMDSSIDGFQLTFSSIQFSDSGWYYCTAQNRLGLNWSGFKTIDVKYGPKSPSVSVSPSGEILEGRSVTLTCNTDANPAATYIWYKDTHSQLNKASKLNFRSIKVSDSGQYSCTAVNWWGRSTSEIISIDVQYGPKRPSVSVSPSGEILEGCSVTLTCNSDANPAATYTWYKDNRQMDSSIDGFQLTFSSIQFSDSGWYYCTAQNRLGLNWSGFKTIDVKYGPKRPSVSVSPSGEILEGRSVTLTCSTDANPAANYTWYKEGDASPVASGQNFTISNVRLEHSGNYSCEAQNIRGRQTLQLTVGAVNTFLKYIGAGVTAAVLLTIVLIIGFFWLRTKRVLKTCYEAEDRADTRDQNGHDGGQPEEQGDLHYATVHFRNNQADPLCSDVRAARPPPHIQKEDVPEYSVVRFQSAASRFIQKQQSAPVVEDSSALYSRVSKP